MGRFVREAEGGQRGVVRGDAMTIDKRTAAAGF